MFTDTSLLPGLDDPAPWDDSGGEQEEKRPGGKDLGDEMESDEKSQLEDEAMNESVMAMINEGTPMDENYFLNQNHVEEPSNKHRIRSTEHTDLSNVRRSELDLDKTGIRGKE